MLCSWEGNRRSGVALAMRHRLYWSIHLRAHGLRKGDEHPAYTPVGVCGTLYLFTFYLITEANDHSWAYKLLMFHGLRKGDEHPAYTPVGVCGTLYLFTFYLITEANDHSWAYKLLMFVTLVHA